MLTSHPQAHLHASVLGECRASCTTEAGQGELNLHLCERSLQLDPIMTAGNAMYCVKYASDSGLPRHPVARKTTRAVSNRVHG